MSDPGKLPRRTRGVKPKGPQAQAAAVTTAVRALERVGAPFTVAEVAEKAGVSRATIYRNPHLRAVIGVKGDTARPVDPAAHARLTARHAALKSKARDLRRRLAEAEQGWEEMRSRATQAERRLQAAERRAEAIAQQGGVSPLAAIAAHAGPEAMRRARRQLARALHPDLFAQDADTAALATELLKTLNSLAD